MHTQSLKQFQNHGYSLIKSMYTIQEIEAISTCLNNHSITEDIFAQRQLINAIPKLKPLIFNSSLKALLQDRFKTKYHLTKAIYFNKPAHSNWFVAYHQDLSISVKNKVDIKHYSGWTNKHNQIGVIPPVSILNNIITVRIHLDNTLVNNGALRIIPNTHMNGILKLDVIQNLKTKEIICEAKPGDTLIMSPLTLHSSNKSSSPLSRRIIHLEFSSLELHDPLEWLEKEAII